MESNLKYYKAVSNKDGNIFFVESGKDNALALDRIEASGWDLHLVEISKNEYNELWLEINKKNRNFLNSSKM